MKYQKAGYCVIILVLIAAFGIAPICFAETNGKLSIEEVKKESLDLVQALKVYTMNQRDEAINKAKVALDNLDKRIEALEAYVDDNWDKMDKATRKKSRESLKMLRKQRNEVAEWYGSLKLSSSDAWGHIKKGFSEAYSNLQDAWEKSEKEFGAD